MFDSARHLVIEALGALLSVHGICESGQRQARDLVDVRAARHLWREVEMDSAKSFGGVGTSNRPFIDILILTSQASYIMCS